MEERSTLARPYAVAVFEQAKEEDAVTKWSELLGFLEGVVSEPTMAGVIADPRVEISRLSTLMLDICEGRLWGTGENLVRVLTESRRLSLLPEIHKLFERRRREFEGQSQVEVISAFELDEQFARVISGAMADRLGRAVDLSVSVDNSLIGGVVIRAGDLVIDASLRGRLNQLALDLT